MKYILTGGSDFTGSHFVNEQAQLHNEVVMPAGGGNLSIGAEKRGIVDAVHQSSSLLHEGDCFCTGNVSGRIISMISWSNSL